MTLLSPELVARIQAGRAEHPRLRERDLAETLGISEAQLLAASLGQDDGIRLRRIAADPARLMPAIARLGDVMALTRNDWCVHERRGRYLDFHAGDHAAMILGPEIDLRIFPRHWVHAFAVERPAEGGPRRSLQVFDAAGDAVHKVHLGEDSDLSEWDGVVRDLALDDGAPFDLTPRAAPELLRINVAKVDALREGWAAMTDTHQFLAMTSRLKFDRLGAYRSIGAPWAQQLPQDAVAEVLRRSGAAGIPIMVFVGNRGCIQIHSGPVTRLEPMGPWFNVLDPRFNLHLRNDKVAEVWLVRKPTRRGDAVSVEGFDDQGRLILQIFGKRAEAETDTGAWDRIAAGLADEVVA
ncbi:hemin-degrading factor [Halodurantibacterium flavum]|uniref:Hemin-degrading factor n=1 Tax=Halodurantibacterium flavum TaxID=1382802 RepID=A0ABW4S2D2_9RHOB